MKTLDRVMGWVLVVMGCIHCGATFAANPHFNFAAVWFFTGGVAMIATGLLNLVRIQGGKGIAKTGAIAVNVLMTLACAAIIWIALGSLLHMPQVIIVTVAVVAELIFSVRG